MADCVASHVAWITLQARACGGAVGRSGAVEWAYVPPSATVHLLFPRDPQADDVAAAVAGADELGATATAIWSAVDRRRPWLRDLGFRRAWQPWWMGASIAEVPAPADPRVTLVQRAREHERDLQPLAERDDVLLAEAVLEGEYAGRAWMHLHGDLAGLYDMAVWPRFQRRRLGRALLGALCAEAARRGATRVTMNATPEGAALYAACGVARLGEGRTWWRRRPAAVAPAVVG